MNPSKIERIKSYQFFEQPKLNLSYAMLEACGKAFAAKEEYEIFIDLPDVHDDSEYYSIKSFDLEDRGSKTKSFELKGSSLSSHGYESIQVVIDILNKGLKISGPHEYIPPAVVIAYRSIGGVGSRLCVDSIVMHDRLPFEVFAYFNALVDLLLQVDHIY